MPRNSKQERERERAGDAKMFRAWKKFHCEERDEVLRGSHAAVLNELFRMFANLESVKSAQLIGFIHAINWAAINHSTRLTVLHEANNAITALRTKRGLEPISDPLPGEPETPFRMIKAIVLSSSPLTRAPTGAQPGSSIPHSQHKE
jgi:hypothetical protein